jgi:hypothetical protein
MQVSQLMVEICISTWKCQGDQARFHDVLPSYLLVRGETAHGAR